MMLYNYEEHSKIKISSNLVRFRVAKKGCLFSPKALTMECLHWKGTLRWFQSDPALERCGNEGWKGMERNESWMLCTQSPNSEGREGT